LSLLILIVELVQEKIITYLEEVDSSSADEEFNSNDFGNELTTRNSRNILVKVKHL